MNSKTNKGFIIPIVVVLALLIIGIIVYFFSPKSKSLGLPTNLLNIAVSPVPTVDPTVNWKAYNDKQNRFSFRYPENFALESKPSQFFESDYLKFDESTRINFLFSDEKVEYKNFDLNYYNVHEYEKDNIKVKIATYINQYSGFPESIYIEGYLYDKNKYQMFKLNTTKDQRDKWEQVFDQILSTFRFTYDIQGMCRYGGKEYKAGEQFKALDGCNSCTCEGTQVSCTEMSCQ